MSNVQIGAPNHVEANTATLSLGGWGSPSTLDNLKDPDFGNPAQSTDATNANSQFGVDLTPWYTLFGSYAPGIDCLFIPRTNLTQAATIDVKCGTAAFTAGGGGGGSVTTICTAQAALTQAVYPTGYESLWGKNSTNVPDKVVDAAYNRGVLVTFARQSKLFWWVRINDTANPDGYISLARLFLVPLFAPTLNMDYGVTIEPYGQRRAETSVSGVDFIDPSLLFRRLVTFSLSDTSEAEALAYWHRLSLFLGYHKQAVFLFDPADTFHKDLRTFAVTQLKPASLAFRNFGTADVNAQFLEIR